MDNKLKKHISLKAAIRDGQIMTGSWLSMGNEEAAEIIASSGYSFAVIDLEHSGIDFKTAEKLIRVIDLSNCSPLVRLSNNDPNQAKRVMDCGAHGIIVPMVNNRGEAEKAVASVYYPPRGIRGVGLYRAQKYGSGFQEYKDWLEEKAVVIIQIESREAIDNLDDILSVKGIDGAIIGPYDLSNSMGVPGDLFHPLVAEAEKKLIHQCKKFGIAPGVHIVHPDKNKLKKRIQEGFTLIAYGVDMIFLDTAARKAFRDFDDT